MLETVSLGQTPPGGLWGFGEACSGGLRRSGYLLSPLCGRGRSTNTAGVSHHSPLFAQRTQGRRLRGRVARPELPATGVVNDGHALPRPSLGPQGRATRPFRGRKSASEAAPAGDS